MEETAEQLEVVGDHDERPEGHERNERRRPRDRRVDAECDGSGNRYSRKRDQRSVRDSRLQRPSHPFVERVRADAHREAEGEHRRCGARPREMRRKCSADRDVRQVPCRVRRVEQRDVVAPAARSQRVKRRARLGTHARRPQTTMPPPRLSRCARTSSMPAALNTATGSWRS